MNSAPYMVRLTWRLIMIADPNVTDYTNRSGKAILRSNNFEIQYDSIVNTSRIKTLSLSSAQLLDVRATPQTLVPAPGDGKIIIPSKCIFEFSYGTVAYTVTNVTLALKMNGITIGSTIAGNVFLTATNNIIYTMPTPDVLPATNPSTLTNQPLTFANIGSAEMLDGDGTLFITLFYDVFTKH